MEIWKTLRVSHIPTPPAATTDKCLTRSYTNTPLGTKDRSGHYDANGDLLNDGSNTYTWDAEGKPLTTTGLSTGGNLWGFTYDAFGHKVEWAVKGVYQHSYLYIGKMKLSATAQVAGYSEFPLPGGSVLSQGGGATGVQVADWLGTIRGMYSATGGTLTQTGAHAPFGESYGYNTGTALAFTGQLGDGVITNGTEYFPERQYRNSQGRWLSPDPAGMGAANPADPQSWNQYAYVGNRPLEKIDPKGLDDCTDFGICDPGGGGGFCDPIFGCGGGGNISITVGVGPGGVTFGIDSSACAFGTCISSQQAQQVQAVAQAIKDKNWGALLALGAGGMSRDIWGRTASGCGDFGACPPIGNNLSNGGLGAAGVGTLVCEIAEPCGLAEDLLLLALFAEAARELHVQKQKEADRREQCSARWDAERAACGEQYARTKNAAQYGACMNRAEWRFSNCWKGVEDPGPPLH